MSKEIIEGNKLIAEFMGAIWRKDDYGLFGYSYSDVGKAPTEHSGYWWDVKALQYHTSWDWLMPVVEKISNIHYPDYWNGRQPDDVGEWDNCAYPRTFGMRDKEGNYMVRFNANVLYSAKTLIEATWLAVIEFIKDYNITENPKQ